MDKSAPLPRESVSVEVLGLADARVRAKEAKDWAKADEIRAQIAGLGYSIKDIKDTKKGGDAAAKYEFYAA